MKRVLFLILTILLESKLGLIWAESTSFFSYSSASSRGCKPLSSSSWKDRGTDAGFKNTSFIDEK